MNTKIKKIYEVFNKIGSLNNQYEHDTYHMPDNWKSSYDIKVDLIYKDMANIIKTMSPGEIKELYKTASKWGDTEGNYTSEYTDEIHFLLMKFLPKYNKNRKLFSDLCGMGYSDDDYHKMTVYRKQQSQTNHKRKAKPTFRSGASQADNLIRNINRISINTNKKFKY